MRSKSSETVSAANEHATVMCMQQSAGAITLVSRYSTLQPRDQTSVFAVEEPADSKTEEGATCEERDQEHAQHIL